MQAGKNGLVASLGEIPENRSLSDPAGFSGSRKNRYGANHDCGRLWWALRRWWLENPSKKGGKMEKCKCGTVFNVSAGVCRDCRRQARLEARGWTYAGWEECLGCGGLRLKWERKGETVVRTCCGGWEHWRGE
jgi:hypothetical protein